MLKIPGLFVAVKYFYANSCFLSRMQKIYIWVNWYYWHKSFNFCIMQWMRTFSKEVDPLLNKSNVSCPIIDLTIFFVYVTCTLCSQLIRLYKKGYRRLQYMSPLKSLLGTFKFLNGEIVTNGILVINLKMFPPKVFCVMLITLSSPK